MTKLKLIQEAQLAMEAGSKLGQLKQLRDTIDPSASLRQIKEMFDVEITKDDYNVWMKHILDMCKERGVRASVRRHFDNCAFEVLDNDPKMDLFLGDDSEKVKHRVANTLWNAYQASVGHERVGKVTAQALKARKKYEEEEETNAVRASLDAEEQRFMDDQAGDDDMDLPTDEMDYRDDAGFGADVDDGEMSMDDDMDRDYSEDDINTATGKYPEEDLGGWDVPLKGQEEEETDVHAIAGSLAKVASAITAVALAAGRRDRVRPNRRTRNPYTKGTSRYDIWNAAYREGFHKGEEHEHQQQQPQQQQPQQQRPQQQDARGVQGAGYEAAKAYYAKVTQGRSVPPPQNPHSVGSPQARAWDDGFDQYMKDVETGE